MSECHPRRIRTSATKPRTAATGGTMGFASAFRRAFDSQPRSLGLSGRVPGAAKMRPIRAIFGNSLLGVHSVPKSKRAWQSLVGTASI